MKITKGLTRPFQMLLWPIPVHMYVEKPRLELKKIDGEAAAGLMLTASNYDGAVEILKA